MPLINCEIRLDFTHSKDCIMSEILINTNVAVNLHDNLSAAPQPEGFASGVTFQEKTLKCVSH